VVEAAVLMSEIEVTYSRLEEVSKAMDTLAGRARSLKRWMLSSDAARTGGASLDAEIQALARTFQQGLEELAGTLTGNAWNVNIALAEYRLTDRCAVPGEPSGP
jgi:hypothetical protein